MRVESVGDQTLVWLARHGDPRARVIAAKEHNALHAIGLGDAIILPNPQSPAPGASNLQSLPSLASWLVPADAIDQTRGTPTTFFANTGLGYVTQSPPFCPETRSAIVRSVNGQYDGIVVAAPERSITPAELRAWGMLGGQFAMPGLGPEWYLCHELEIGYAPLCHASWLDGQEQPLTEAAARPIIERIAAELPETHSWEASNAGARREYSDDWRTWIKAET